VPGTPATHLRLDIQGLRAVAVLAVVFFHAGIFFPGGFVGVDMFFVISGFVITLTLMRNALANGAISLKKFYLRRFRRLAPALALVILVTLALSALVLSPLGTQQNAALTGLAAALSLGNVAIALTTGGYFDAPAELNPFLHTWSLGVEEQFYVIFPLAIIAGLWLWRKRLAPRGAALLVVWIITASSFALTVLRNFLPDIVGQSAFLGFYSPVTRAWEFGVGALIALWLMNRTTGFQKPVTNGLYLVGFIALAYSFVALSGQSDFPGVITLVPVLGTAALIVAGQSSEGVGFRSLATRPLVAIGDWSYSIYLWHWPFVSLAKVVWEDVTWIAPFAAAVSFIPAIAAYYLVEQRYRYREFGHRKILTRGIVLFVGIPVVASAVMWITPTLAFGDELEDATRAPISYEVGCHVEAAFDTPPEACVFDADPTKPPSPPIYLIGDSNAAHYSDGLVEAATIRNSVLTVMTARRCPFILDTGELEGNIVRAEECDWWEGAVLDRLASSEPGIVIISASDIYWLQEIGPLRLAGDDLTPSAEQLVAGLQAAYDNTVTAVREAGHEVILVQTVPHWVNEYHWDLADCSLVEVLNDCDEQMPASYYLQRTGDIRGALSNGAHSAGATEVDFLDVLCPDGTCHTRGDGYWMYRNANHLSNSTSRLLHPLWVHILDGK
jgi:peptidoglycan/LPS O-acetylase OafA/YrhL